MSEPASLPADGYSSHSRHDSPSLVSRHFYWLRIDTIDTKRGQKIKRIHSFKSLHVVCLWKLLIETAYGIDALDVMSVPSQRWSFIWCVEESELVSPWVHSLVVDLVEFFDLIGGSEVLRSTTILTLLHSSWSLTLVRVSAILIVRTKTKQY